MKIFLIQGIGKLHFDEYCRAIKKIRPSCDVVVIGGFANSRLIKNSSFYLRNYSNRMKYLNAGAVVCNTNAAYLAHYILNKIAFKQRMLENIAFWIAANIYSIQASLILLTQKRENESKAVIRSGYGGRLLKLILNKKNVSCFVDASIENVFPMNERMASYHCWDSFFSRGLPFWNRVNSDVRRFSPALYISDHVKSGYPEVAGYVVHLPVRSELEVIAENIKPRDFNKCLFVGDFSARKGAGILTDFAAKTLSESYQKLIVCGEVNYFSVSNLTSIEYRGRVGPELLKELFANCGVFIFPTLGEGMARVVVEALFQGIEIITTKYCGLPTYILEKYCHVIDPVDAIEISTSYQKIKNGCLLNTFAKSDDSYLFKIGEYEKRISESLGLTDITYTC